MEKRRGGVEESRSREGEELRREVELSGIKQGMGNQGWANTKNLGHSEQNQECRTIL